MRIIEQLLITQTEALIIPHDHILRKPNSIIVLLLIFDLLFILFF